MFCTQCGTETGKSPFCFACGASLGPKSSTPHFAEPAAPTPSRRSSTPPVVAAATVAVVVAVLLTVIFLNTRNEPDSDAVAPAAVDTSTLPPTTAVPSTGTAPAKPAKNKPHRHDDGPGNVKDLRAGLFCRDLSAKGYSYAAAVDYWRMHGQPDQMDVDLNGLPCETVYPSLNVTSYWGARQAPGSSVPASDPQGTIPAASTLPPGLFCRDLYARGYSYSAAVDYWRMYGEPDQMDIDYNDIPCETVYPATDVSSYWGASSYSHSYGLSANLMCSDLYARGVSYPDAVAYWWTYGAPDRMDIDLNGIPCETVYSVYDVNAFWY